MNGNHNVGTFASQSKVPRVSNLPNPTNDMRKHTVNESTSLPQHSQSAVNVAKTQQFKCLALDLAVANMRAVNLQTLHQQGSYEFDLKHYKELAQNLDSLHETGHVHRNIKPACMYFYDHQVYMVGHKSVGQVGSFTESTYSSCYVTQAMINGSKSTHDNGARTDNVNAYKRDQYAFFLSMMQAKFDEIPGKVSTVVGHFSDHEEKAKQFADSLPCDDTQQWEVFHFLLDPVKNILSFPIAEYL